MIVTPHHPGDLPYLYDSWLKGWRSYCRNQPTSGFYHWARPIADAILADSPTILTLRDSEDSDWLAGYLIYTRTPESLTIHWGSIKLAYRGLGYAEKLLAQALAEPLPLNLHYSIRHVQARKTLDPLGFTYRKPKR